VNEIGYTETKKIETLLLGRKVVAATIGEIERGWGTEDGAILTLDNGAILHVIPNQGGCACSAGDYYVTALNRVDNVITGVAVHREITRPDDYEPDEKYVISVFAGDERINVVEMDGSDGNGYYGTGFTIIVSLPKGGSDVDF
jgi:hypothetical protein